MKKKGFPFYVHYLELTVGRVSTFSFANSLLFWVCIR